MLEDENADDWIRSVMEDVVFKLVAAVSKDVVDETLSVELFTSVIVEEEGSGTVGGAVVIKDTVEVEEALLVGVVAVGVVGVSVLEVLVKDAVDVVGASVVAAVVVEVTL